MVRIEVVPVPRTDGQTWYSLRISNEQGGAHSFGFEPTPELAIERWAFEAVVFAIEWCKPPAATGPGLFAAAK